MTIVSRILRRAINASLVAWNARLDRELTTSLACFPRDWIGRAITVDGLYERDLLELIARQVLSQIARPGAVMFDIGANIGNHTVFFSRYFQQVFAFEPNPVAQHLLRANVLFNACTGVEVLTYGLGLRDEQLLLHVPHGNLGAARFGGEPRVGDRSIQCPIKKGDDVVRTLLAADTSLAFVKIDVEGFELDVIAGLEQTLRTHQPVVAFESHSAGGSHGGRMVAERLRALGIGHLYVPVDPIQEQRNLRALLGRARDPVLELAPIHTLEDGYHRLVLASPRPL